jgi:hypothetical protein
MWSVASLIVHLCVLRTAPRPWHSQQAYCLLCVWLYCFNHVYSMQCVKLGYTFHFGLEKHNFRHFRHFVTSQPATYLGEFLSLIHLNNSVIWDKSLTPQQPSKVMAPCSVGLVCWMVNYFFVNHSPWVTVLMHSVTLNQYEYSWTSQKTHFASLRLS